MSKLALSVDLNNPVQENFLGNGAIYHGYAGLPDHKGRVYTPEQCKIEADRAGDMKLKIARTFYGWYAWEDGKWNWESQRMQVFYRWVKDLQERGIDIALQAGWCNPGDVNSTSWNGESPFTVEGDWEKSVENYAAWVSESVHQLVEVRGFTNVKYLVLFTEPQHPSGKNPEGKASSYNTWLDCVKAAHEKLTVDGRRDLVKFVGPNEGSTTTSEMLKWAAENANDYIDIYSSHNYLTADTIGNSEIASGNRAVRLQIPGARANQTVTLKPNTDYEVSAYVLFKTENALQTSGYIVFGAFTSTGSGATISAGGSPTNRLTRDSVKMVDGATLNEQFQKITNKFNSGDNTVAEIGLFYDIKDKGAYLVLDDFTLQEVGSDVNILVDPSFESSEGWKYVAASSGATDSYYDWQLWAQTGIQYVPKGKTFWFDEYNVQFDARYEDPRHGSRIAVAAVGLMNVGAQSSLLWTVFDQQWPNNDVTNNDCFVDGDHRCGLMPVLSRSLVPYSGYNAFAIISKYVGGEGTKVYAGKGENNVQFTVTVQPDGSKTVVVVNSKDASDEFEIDFGTNLGCTLYRHLFDPETEVQTEKAEITGVDKIFEHVQNTLSDSIPGFGVAVYTSIKD